MIQSIISNLEIHNPSKPYWASHQKKNITPFIYKITSFFFYFKFRMESRFFENIDWTCVDIQNCVDIIKELMEQNMNMWKWR